MKRKQILLSLISLSIISPIISGCSVLENGDINDYVGEYTVIVSYERKKHHYWNTSTLISETYPIPLYTSLEIKSDKTAYLLYPDATYESRIKGRVRVFKEYVKFTGFSFSSSYKFDRKDDRALDYSYVEDKYGLEYDYTTRRIVFSYLTPEVE